MAYQRKTPEENRSDWRRGIREGFDASGGVTCKGCFALRNENARLKEEIRRLQQKLKYHGSGGKRLAVGAHTPSSKLELKPNAEETARSKRGGARSGHQGHGRKSCAPDDADEVITVKAPPCCAHCNGAVVTKDYRHRTVIESVPVTSKRVVYRLERAVCVKCRRESRAQAPVLSKSLYGNSLLSQAAVMHYIHGVPLGRVLGLLGPNVTLGGLIQGFHRLGSIAEKAKPVLVEQYRQSPVRHADETGWRNDGRSGFAWLFTSERTTLFEFRQTRASSVPREILGEGPLSGVLVVDRYCGYNRLPVEIQYCYAHLLREVRKTAEEFPDDPKVKDFTDRLGLCLTQAMRLRSSPISDRQYYRRAKQLRTEIEALCDEPHRHLAVKSIQRIFVDQRRRLYHWVKDRRVPPDNNRAERELRPTVIARKVSFGSQSDAGAKTRGNLMSLLHTVAKRTKGTSAQQWLKEALDHIARSPETNIASLLPQ